MTQFLILQPDTLHPLLAWEAFGWDRVEDAAHFLQLSSVSLHAYKSKRRKPSATTLQRIYFQCDYLIGKGITPKNINLLPIGLQEKISQK